MLNWLQKGNFHVVIKMRHISYSGSAIDIDDQIYSILWISICGCVKEKQCFSLLHQVAVMENDITYIWYTAQYLLHGKCPSNICLMNEWVQYLRKHLALKLEEFGSKSILLGTVNLGQVVSLLLLILVYKTGTIPSKQGWCKDYVYWAYCCYLVMALGRNDSSTSSLSSSYKCLLTIQGFLHTIFHRPLIQ